MSCRRRGQMTTYIKFLLRLQEQRLTATKLIQHLRPSRTNYCNNNYVMNFKEFHLRVVKLIHKYAFFSFFFLIIEA